MSEQVKPEEDMVNHPRHYTDHPTGVECIDIIEHGKFFSLSQAMKYIWRVNFGSKGSDLQDLKKARWYIDRQIKKFETEDVSDN